MLSFLARAQPIASRESHENISFSCEYLSSLLIVISVETESVVETVATRTERIIVALRQSCPMT